MKDYRRIPNVGFFEPGQVQFSKLSQLLHFTSLLASDQNLVIFIFLHIFTVKKKADLSTGSKSSLSGSFHGIYLSVFILHSADCDINAT